MFYYDGLLWIHSLSSSEQSALNLTLFLLTENFYPLQSILNIYIFHKMSQHQSRYNYKINKMHKSGHYRKSETQNLGIFKKNYATQ